MKKTVATLLVMAMALTLLLGCAGTAAASELKGEVTFMVLDAMTKAETDGVYVAAKAFEALHPGVKVIIEPVPATNLKDKYTNAALAGAGPDVVSLDTGGWIVDAAAIGILAELDEKLAPIAGEFQYGSLLAGKYGEHFYAVPWYVNSAGLYYNKTILAEAGIANPPATWAEFEAAVAAVTAKGHKALTITSTPAYFMYPFFFQNDNFVIDTSVNPPVSIVNTQSGREAFEFFMNIFLKYDGFPESTKDALTWDQVYAPFIQGDVAFMICGDWGQATVAAGNPSLDFGIAQLPKGKQGGTVMGGYSLCIGKNTKNFDAAWAFVEFLTAREQNDVLLSYGRIGARKDIDQAALIAVKPHLEVFIKQAGDAYARPTVKALTEADDILSRAFQNVYLGQMTIDEALAACEKQVNELMAEKYQ